VHSRSPNGENRNMNNDPFQIDNQKRSNYQGAHALAPLARITEQDAVLRLMDVPPNSSPRVLELGAGSGFLTEVLVQQGMRVDTIDPYNTPLAEGVKHFSDDTFSGLSHLHHTGVKYDYIVSLASLHHIIPSGSNCLPALIVQQMYQLLESDGKVVLVDVMDQSNIEVQSSRPVTKSSPLECVCRTYDFFVRVIDQLALPKHKGNYACVSSMSSAYESYGFSTRYQSLKTPWSFISTTQLAEFLRMIFCLDLDSKGILNLANDIIGTSQCDNRILLEWGLGGFCCEKV
jgi:phospholipid N-methyltransferase